MSPRVGSSFAGQPEYTFKHILTRDVAYDSIPRRDRGSAHAQVARWLEGTAGDRACEFGELLAHHYAAAVSLAEQAGAAPDPDLRASALHWLLRASDDARCKYVLGRAERLAHDALALAQGDVERCDALTALGETAMTGMRGDLAWQHFTAAAAVADQSPDIPDKRTAQLIARACDLPVRWPGMMSIVVPEPEARALRDRGLELAGPGDSRERANLLAISASWPFAYPDDSNEPPEDYVARGLEAVDIALRLGDVDLASGCYDAAAGVYNSRGDYRASMTIWRRRWELRDRITDDLEVVDLHAVGAWASWEVGEYDDAVRYAEAIEGRIQHPGASHAQSWRVAALYRLGRWDEALAAFAVVRAGSTTNASCRPTPAPTCTARRRSSVKRAASIARPTPSRRSSPACRSRVVDSTAGARRWRCCAARTRGAPAAGEPAAGVAGARLGGVGGALRRGARLWRVGTGRPKCWPAPAATPTRPGRRSWPPSPIASRAPPPWLAATPSAPCALLASARQEFDERGMVWEAARTRRLLAVALEGAGRAAQAAAEQAAADAALDGARRRERPHRRRRPDGAGRRIARPYGVGRARTGNWRAIMVLHVTTSAPARGQAGKSPHEGGSGSPWPGWVDLLAQVPLFRELPKRSLKRVARLAHLRWYADGWTVVRAGTSGDAFYAILDGHAQVHTPDGDNRLLGSDDFFGELALLDDAPRTATVTSNGGLTVARIARGRLRPAAARRPGDRAGPCPRPGRRGARGRRAARRRAARPWRAQRPRAGPRGARRRGGRLAERAPATRPVGEAGAAADRVALLARIPLFEPLNKRHLRRVARLGEPASYEAGEALARAGVRGDAFYVILDGAARVDTADGHEHTLGPRDFFGEFALLDGAPRSATVTATEPLTTLRIGQPDFEKLLRADPAIAVGLAKGLAAIVRDLAPAERPKGSPRR